MIAADKIVYIVYHLQLIKSLSNSGIIHLKNVTLCHHFYNAFLGGHQCSAMVIFSIASITTILSHENKFHE